MKVQLEKTFPVAATAEAAWALLQDIEAVAACMPGARITERLDANRYRGTVAVKVGPASMSFRGELEVLALETATRTLRLVGKGTDATGGSGAAMDLTARVEAVDGQSCRLVGTSEVTMSGKAAAFGGRLMQSVAEQILKQFADNFSAQAQQRAVPPAANAAAPTPAGDVAPASPVAVPAPKTQLNALALLWGALRDWLRGLFAPRRA
ncbi:MAG: SRPBCC family protein [Burkholderiaceae bacterium]|nr:SRPBCC family protein [Burkholderiaceae bacterium]